MSVSVEEQLRMLGRAFGEFVDEVGVDDVLDTTRTTPAMRTVSVPGMARELEHPTTRHRLGGAALGDQKPRWGRRATLVAAAIVIVAGVVGVLVVAQRPVDAPSGPTSAPQPAWYSALAPLLPDGYEHVAVLQSHQSFVNFEAFNPDSSKSLSFTVSRSAMLQDRSGVTMTLAEAQAEPWTDPNLEYDISLTDGRQVGVYCWFRAMPENEPNCPDIDGDRTDPEMLRAFAVALATELSPNDLPTRASELDHVTTATIRSTIKGLDPEAGIELEAPHYSSAFVQHGNAIDGDVLIVRTVSGFYPPLPADTQRATASFNGHRLTWQPIRDDTIWYVNDNPNSGLDVADEILDRAAGVTDIERSIAPPSINSDDLTDPATTTLGALVAPELPSGFDLVYTVDAPVPFAVAIDPDGNRLEDQRVQGALDTWSSCVETRTGQQADTPNELARRFLDGNYEGSATAEELAVATADAECQQESDLWATWYTVVAELTRHRLGADADLYDAWTRARVEMVDSAGRTLAERNIELPSLD